MEKVFCKDCKNFRDISYNKDTCIAEDNISYKPTWYRNIPYYKKHPKRINKKNNCGWYILKEKEITKQYEYTIEIRFKDSDEIEIYNNIKLETWCPEQYLVFTKQQDISQISISRDSILSYEIKTKEIEIDTNK